MTSSGPDGIFTTVLTELREQLRERLRLRDLWRDTNTFADAAGAPDEWVVCPLCGAQDWRLPPHGIGDPCPIATKMTEALGMRFDAERMLSVRAGVHLEEMRRVLEERLGEVGDDDD